MKLLIATRNRGKVREVRDALEGLGVDLVDLSRWPSLASPEETGKTFLENAVLKAEYYARATEVAALADDSGLEVDALGGAPGIASARFLGGEASYAEKIQGVLEALAGVPPERRTARFWSALALAGAETIRWSLVEACEGFIAEAPHGAEGFGYDPIFYYPPLDKTFGEARIAEKRGVSARGKALLTLAQHLQRLDHS